MPGCSLTAAVDEATCSSAIAVHPLYERRVDPLLLPLTKRPGQVLLPFILPMCAELHPAGAFILPAGAV